MAQRAGVFPFARPQLSSFEGRSASPSPPCGVVEQAEMGQTAGEMEIGPWNGRYLRTTAIDHRQTMAAFPTICRRSRDLFGVGLRELPGPIQRGSSRPMRTFPPADGKPELMIDCAHGGPSRNNNSLRSRAGIDATSDDAEPASMVGSVHSGSHPTATSACPPPRSKPTRLPAFFSVVLATRLFAPTLKCGL
jgi:hypothetical protein